MLPTINLGVNNGGSFIGSAPRPAPTATFSQQNSGLMAGLGLMNLDSFFGNYQQGPLLSESGSTTIYPGIATFHETISDPIYRNTFTEGPETNNITVVPATQADLMKLFNYGPLLSQKGSVT